MVISTSESLAEELGGQCLSAEYINQRTKLLFKRVDGHEWLASPNNVYNKGSECPHCSGNARLSIEDAYEAATAFGGV